jgi:hypothetical protein
MEGNDLLNKYNDLVKCEICGMAFIDKLKLNDHFNLVHKQGQSVE